MTRKEIMPSTNPVEQALHDLIEVQKLQIATLKEQAKVYDASLSKSTMFLKQASVLIKAGAAEIERLQRERNSAAEEAEFFKTLVEGGIRGDDSE